MSHMVDTVVASSGTGESERFQVKINGQWTDYGPKEDEVLKQAFDKFIRVAREPSWRKHEHREAFKELVIKSRRYVVDFQKMVQVRKDNKKDYKVRPPMQFKELPDSSTDESQLGQADLALTCEWCQQVYTLRREISISDDLDWADCHWCQICWRPSLVKEEKKNEKNQKSRAQVPPSLPKERFSISATLGATKGKDDSTQPNQCQIKLLTTSEKCALCGRGFYDSDLIYLNVYVRPSMACHESCFKSCAEPVTLSDGFVPSRDVLALEAQVFAY